MKLKCKFQLENWEIKSLELRNYCWIWMKLREIWSFKRKWGYSLKSLLIRIFWIMFRRVSPMIRLFWKVWGYLMRSLLFLRRIRIWETLIIRFHILEFKIMKIYQMMRIRWKLCRIRQENQNLSGIREIWLDSRPMNNF